MKVDKGTTLLPRSKHKKPNTRAQQEHAIFDANSLGIIHKKTLAYRNVSA